MSDQTHTKSPWRKILIDSILINILVYLFMAVVVFVLPFKLKSLNPIKEMIRDIDYTDLYFSKFKDQAKVSSNIVVVNVAQIDREGIGMLIKKVNAANPKAIGIDLLFEKEKGAIDSILIESVANNNKIVAVSKLVGPSLIESFKGLQLVNKATGSLLGDSLTTKTIRQFVWDYPMAGNNKVNSFAAELLKVADLKQYTYLKEKINSTKKINYKPQTSFITYDPFTVLSEQSSNIARFKDKVVLIGYTGGANNVYDIEDKHFTPLNPHFAGRSLPDMNGIYIHANILENLIEEDYINLSSSILEIIISIIMSVILGMLIVKSYVFNPKWYHFTAKMVQIILSISFLFISIWIMAIFNLKINFSILFFASVLVCDIIYFYDPVTKFLAKRKIFNSTLLHH